MAPRTQIGMGWAAVYLLLVLSLAGCFGQPSEGEIPDAPEPPHNPPELGPLGTLSCTDACPVELGLLDAFEPTLAAAADGTVLVAHTPFVAQLRTLEIFVRSPDGTWSSPTLAIPLASAVLEGCTEIFDPATLILADGTMVVVAIGGGANSRVMFSLTSTDGGATWGGISVIVGSSGGCAAPASATFPDFVRAVEHAEDEPWIVWREYQPDGGCATCFGLATTSDGEAWQVRHLTTSTSSEPCMGANSIPHATWNGTVWIFVSSAWRDGEPTHYCFGVEDAGAVRLEAISPAYVGWAVVTWSDGGWAMAGSVPVGNRFQSYLWQSDATAPLVLGPPSTTTSATQIATQNGAPWVLWAVDDGSAHLRLSNGRDQWTVAEDITPHASNLEGPGHYIGFDVTQDTVWAAWTRGAPPQRQLVVSGFSTPFG